MEVGIDIEKILPLEDLNAHAQTILSEKETALFYHIPPEGRLEFFYRVWTRKEAFLKAQGKGLLHPILEVELAHIPIEKQATLILPDQKGQPQAWTSNHLDLSYGNELYSSSVCIKGDQLCVSHFQFSEDSVDLNP